MVDRPRIGAYILAADPTWLRSSLARYYDNLDVLVISMSSSNTGWTGSPIRADECAKIIESMDRRGVVRWVRGEWQDPSDPPAAEVRQRQAAIDAMAGEVDWILQIDSDEVLPDLAALIRVIARADGLGVEAIEWPMRVLYRRLRNGRYLQVVSQGGRVHYEYPGPIAVRPTAVLVDARRTAGAFIRPVVVGDTESFQLTRPAAPDEVRLEIVDADAAIVHNSWARRARDVHAKVSSWGHNRGLRTRVYFYVWWLPSPLRWRRMRDFHPLFPALWPRLDVGKVPESMIHPDEL
jgi:hypothetical protein